MVSKRSAFVIIFVLAFALFHACESFAVSPARDWVWSFTEVRDANGHTIAKHTGYTSEPLAFVIDPSIGRLKLYATLFNNQALNSSNIDFMDIHTYGRKIGPSPDDFYDLYNLSVAGSWSLDMSLPISACHNYGPFLVMDVYLQDANNPVLPGAYGVFDTAIDIYDLQEPLNQFGRHTLYSIEASNDITWTVTSETVVPEPAPFLVLDSGAIVIDFGPQYGIWIYWSDGLWTQLHTISPDSMIAAHLDGDEQNIEDLVIDFGAQYGIWIYYNNSTWSQLHTISPKSITSGDLDNNGQDDLIIDFGSQYGIWIYYNNSTWSQLHNISPETITRAQLDSDPRSDLVIDFGAQYGIWIYYNNSTWSQLHTISPKSITSGDLDNNGQDDLIIDFGSQYGIWIYYNNSTWSQLHTVSAKSITVGSLNPDPKKDLLIDFGPQYGIWVYADNSLWSQYSPLSADYIVAGDIDGNGIDEVIVDFGPEYGIRVRNDDGHWWQLHNVSP